MPVTTGSITVDGTDLSAVARTDWFAHVASVPQDIVLLNDTLATNIVLGRPFDRARLRRAADRAAILTFIDGLGRALKRLWESVASNSLAANVSASPLPVPSTPIRPSCF